LDVWKKAENLRLGRGERWERSSFMDL